MSVHLYIVIIYAASSVLGVSVECLRHRMVASEHLKFSTFGNTFTESQIHRTCVCCGSNGSTTLCAWWVENRNIISCEHTHTTCTCTNSRETATDCCDTCLYETTRYNSTNLLSHAWCYDHRCHDNRCVRYSFISLLCVGGWMSVCRVWMNSRACLAALKKYRMYRYFSDFTGMGWRGICFQLIGDEVPKIFNVFELSIIATIACWAYADPKHGQPAHWWNANEMRETESCQPAKSNNLTRFGRTGLKTLMQNVLLLLHAAATLSQIIIIPFFRISFPVCCICPPAVASSTRGGHPAIRFSLLIRLDMILQCV